MRTQGGACRIITCNKLRPRLDHQSRMCEWVTLLPHLTQHKRTTGLRLQRREMRRQCGYQRQETATSRAAKRYAADTRQAIVWVDDRKGSKSGGINQLTGKSPRRSIGRGNGIGSTGHGFILLHCPYD